MQATLNSFYRVYGDGTFMSPRDYMKSYLQLRETDPAFGGAFMAKQISKEFRKLAAQYSEAV
jgi:hypothetical protein